MTLLVAMVSPISCNICPNQCICLPLINEKIVDCGNQGLSSIPHDIPADTTALVLRKNSIKSLELLISQSLPYLKVLDLAHNKISYVHEAAFSSTPKLDIIYLNNNELNSFDSAAFSALKALDMIDVSYNTIWNVTIGWGPESPTSTFSINLKFNNVKVINMHHDINLFANQTYQIEIRGNPIDCSCRFLLLVFEVLRNIRFPGICFSPIALKGMAFEDAYMFTNRCVLFSNGDQTDLSKTIPGISGKKSEIFCKDSKFNDRYHSINKNMYIVSSDQNLVECVKISAGARFSLTKYYLGMTLAYVVSLIKENDNC